MFTYCLYWTQYSCNFLVYAARSDQYRKAYSDFLIDQWNKIINLGNKRNTLDSLAILFVDKSILPPKLLQFYAHNPRFMEVNSNLSKSKKSVRFDMKNIQKNKVLPLSSGTIKELEAPALLGRLKVFGHIQALKCLSSCFSDNMFFLYIMNHWPWTADSFEKFQNAIFFKISQIPSTG